ncbi:CMD domain protein [Variovorax boronicumulans]|uniref:CMD domain protein n=1 Tax=Variovorax boronicumulans TaxID=436515 RepID=A0AAW8CQ30_9BURK|nr:CMD domain protein [Variovorax boronicumulans]MDP9891062.1 CMD domain protein [Variovorax boronicumulans]MDP9991479.1 CMD domain protein [Variovorax boronicumulans]MDQ0003157.1 CMD domain protein [Variovorax boronicumulans]MDQ0051129.1 CMD domain protein [Variovorax boronicumulans]
MSATVSSSVPDVIDRLAGITPGSHLDQIRAQREQARTNAQQSYLSLFAPTPPVFGNFEIADRFAVAAFVAALHGQPDVARFYADALAGQGARTGVAEAIALEVQRSAAEGPYGRYPAGPLSAEDVSGPSYAVDAAQRSVLGERLSAGLAHAHLLVFHPRDASPGALQSLLDAGWSSTEVVTLSQLVAFLAFQIRVVIGLRALAQRPVTLVD